MSDVNQEPRTQMTRRSMLGTIAAGSAAAGMTAFTAACAPSGGTAGDADGDVAVSPDLGQFSRMFEGAPTFQDVDDELKTMLATLGLHPT